MSLIRILTAGLFCTVALPVVAGEKGKPAPAQGSVRLRLEVELEGVLSYTEKQVTIRIPAAPQYVGLLPVAGNGTKAEDVWVLDLGPGGKWRKQAKLLAGKKVQVTGTCLLRGVRTETFKYYGSVPAIYPPLPPREEVGSRSVLDVERKVRVRGLEQADND